MGEKIYSPLRHHERVPTALPVVAAAWTAKASRFWAFMEQVGSEHSLLPNPISTLGSCHPKAHRAVLSLHVVSPLEQ